jgi:hypothetical protein
MRIGLVATLAVASVVVLGCADNASNAPTDPGLTLRANHTTGGACSSATSRLADTELTYMLSGASLREAQRLWRTVKSACSTSNPDAANAPLFVYADYLRQRYPTGFIQSPTVGTPESNFLGHLNTIFEYVGYPAPSLAGGATGPLTVGIVGIIHSTGGTREYQRKHLGAFKLPVQDLNGDRRAHLFVMKPGLANCLSVDNLTQVGNCVLLDAYPSVSPRFSPVITVGWCSPNEIEPTGGALALGHEKSPGNTLIAGEASYPTDCHESVNVASNSGAFENILTRLAAFGGKTFGIRSLYAADKGLGGIGSTLSPWGPVDARIFTTGFNSPHQIGSPPQEVEGSYTFSYAATAPGSILIQGSLGDLSGPLVVMNQGGGACANCGSLEMRAHFYSESGTAADDGVYEINWRSVQAAPGVKGAPFVIRAGSDSTSNELARLTYTTQQSVNKLMYNGVDILVPWVRNEAQSFKVVVDLNNGWTQLYVNGTPRTGQVSFTGQRRLGSIAAEFSGIDSGTMGWDDIGVRRLVDQP